MKGLTEYALFYLLALSLSLSLYFHSRPEKIEFLDMTKYKKPTLRKFQIKDLKILKEYEFMQNRRPAEIAAFAFLEQTKEFNPFDVEKLLPPIFVLDSISHSIHIVEAIGFNSIVPLIYKRGNELLLPMRTVPYLRNYIINNKNKLLFSHEIKPEEGSSGIAGLFDLNYDDNPEVLMSFISPGEGYVQRRIALFDMSTKKKLWELKDGAGVFSAFTYDINKDGIEEILTYSKSHENGSIGSGSVEIGRTQFWILDRFGNIIFRKTFWGFFSNVYPIIDDLDNDGNDELILTHFTHYLWYRGRIEILPLPELKTKYKFDFKNDPPHIPYICDINDDGEKEIIVGTSHGRILILNDKLQIVKDTLYKSFRDNYDLAIITIIQVIDLDGDGRKEIIANVNLIKIYVQTPRGNYQDVKIFTLILDKNLNILKRIQGGRYACVYDINHDGINELILKLDHGGTQIWGFE